MIGVKFYSNPSGANIKLIHSSTPTPTPVPTQSPDCVDLSNKYYDLIDEFDTDNNGKISSSELYEAWLQNWNRYLDEDHYLKIEEFHDKDCTLPFKPTPSPTPQADINQFRNKCISNNKVKCSWSTIRSWLIDRRVASIWWLLNQTERKSIAEIAVKNTLYYMTWYGKDGKDNCEGPTSISYDIVCLHNAIIRTQIFGTPVPGSKKCYYLDNLDKYQCYYTPNYYGLPAHDVELRVYKENQWAHAVCGIQINKNMNDINSWVLFQYGNWDIKRGNWQFPGDEINLHCKVFLSRHINSVKSTSIILLSNFQVY